MQKKETLEARNQRSMDGITNYLQIKRTFSRSSIAVQSTDSSNFITLKGKFSQIIAKHMLPQRLQCIPCSGNFLLHAQTNQAYVRYMPLMIS